MKVEFREAAKIGANCQIRLGIGSWDKQRKGAKSVKFAWLDKNGKTARGGEFPVEALPQALDFAIRMGYIQLCCERKRRS